MDFSSLKRDDIVIKASVTVTPDKRMLTKTGCKIIIPSRYIDKGLAVLGNVVNCVAIFAMVVNDQTYSVMSADAMMPLTPDSISEVTIGDEKYHEFSFNKGSVVCPNMNLVKSNVFIYEIYAEFYSKGKYPCYFNRRDCGMVLSTAQKHGGLSLGANNLPCELVASYVTRDGKNVRKFFRHIAKSMKDDKTKPYIFIPLTSVAFGTQDTTAKIGGAYLDEGITSGLVDQADSISIFERILRT